MIYIITTLFKENKGQIVSEPIPKFPHLDTTAGCLDSLKIKFVAFSSPNVAKVVQRGNRVV